MALAEMAFAGGLGAEVDLTGVIQQFVPNIADADRATVALFSESNTRFLVELAPEHADRFRKYFTEAIPLGAVTAQLQLRVTLGSQGSVVDLSLFRLKSAWQTPLW